MPKQALIRLRLAHTGAQAWMKSRQMVSHLAGCAVDHLFGSLTKLFMREMPEHCTGTDCFFRLSVGQDFASESTFRHSERDK